MRSPAMVAFVVVALVMGRETKAEPATRQPPAELEEVPPAAPVPMDGLAPGSQEAQKRQLDFVAEQQLPVEVENTIGILMDSSGLMRPSNEFPSYDFLSRHSPRPRAGADAPAAAGSVQEGACPFVVTRAGGPRRRSVQALYAAGGRICARPGGHRDLPRGSRRCAEAHHYKPADGDQSADPR